ncbi:MAG: FAD-binding protein, partial [Bacteroidetes bacterium]|nr:FAD-binding protein [Bacteroidota bacterium]
MPQLITIQLSPIQAKDDLQIKKNIANHLSLRDDKFIYIWKKRSIDARKRNIKINATFEVFSNNEIYKETIYQFQAKDVSQAPKIHIIGAGPAGLFAALQAIESG